ICAIALSTGIGIAVHVELRAIMALQYRAQEQCDRMSAEVAGDISDPQLAFRVRPIGPRRKRWSSGLSNVCAYAKVLAGRALRVDVAAQSRGEQYVALGVQDLVDHVWLKA